MWCRNVKCHNVETAFFHLEKYMNLLHNFDQYRTMALLFVVSSGLLTYTNLKKKPFHFNLNGNIKQQRQAQWFAIAIPYSPRAHVRFLCLCARKGASGVYWCLIPLILNAYNILVVCVVCVVCRCCVYKFVKIDKSLFERCLVCHSFIRSSENRIHEFFHPP